MSADDPSQYLTVLNEFRERLVKYTNRVRETQYTIAFKGHPSPPEFKLVDYGDLALELFPKEFFRALVLLLAEQEMRLRETERAIEKIGAFAQEFLAVIKKEVGQDKLDELVRMAEEKTKKESN